jgi:hypothetical protein
MSARFERATLRAATFRPAAGAAAGVVAFLVLMVASLLIGAPTSALLDMMGAFVAAFASLALAKWPPKRSQVGTVTSDERGLHSEGALVAPTLRLLDGRVRWRRAGSPYVDFLDARIQVDLARDEDAFALIEALALERTRGATSFTAAGAPNRWVTVAAVVGSAAFTVASMHAGWMVGLVNLMTVGAPFALKSHVHVGRDGILVRCFGWSRFTPYTEIVRIEHDRTNVWMHTLDGRRLRIPGARGLEGALRRAIARSRPEDDVANRLAQAGRSAREWLSALRGVRPRPSEIHYRVAQVPDARLWAVVEDGRAEPSARLGAAAALADGIDEGGRVRLADVARATADPRLRVALHRIADPGASTAADTDAVERVLERWSEGADP